MPFKSFPESVLLIALMLGFILFGALVQGPEEYRAAPSGEGVLSSRIDLAAPSAVGLP
ncbi:MAG: hypothetical protein R3D33_08180 [Hyphomicrobiaceae bacterium]